MHNLENLRDRLSSNVKLFLPLLHMFWFFLKKEMGIGEKKTSYLEGGLNKNFLGDKQENA